MGTQCSKCDAVDFIPAHCKGGCQNTFCQNCVITLETKRNNLVIQNFICEECYNSISKQKNKKKKGKN